MRIVLLLLFISTLTFEGKSQNQDLALYNGSPCTYVDLLTLPQWIQDSTDDGFTVEFWMKADYSLYNTGNVLFSLNDNSYENILRIRISSQIESPDSVIVLSTTSGGVTTDYFSDYNLIGDGNCHHIAFTYNNGTCNIYIDGELELSKNYFFSIQYDDIATLGAALYYGIGYTNCIKAYFDNFKFWNYPKNNSEIAILADSTNIVSNEGLMIHYSFNDAIGGGNNDNIEENVLDLIPSHAYLENFTFNSTNSNYFQDPCNIYDGTLNTQQEINELKFEIIKQHNNLVISSKYDGPLKYFIYDLSGKLLQTESLFHSNISSLPLNLKTGLYIIKLTTTNKFSTSHKVMWYN